MSFVQIESFVAVAEEGHLGRAARRLHISQPPLTRRIQALEDELEVALFERTPRGMRLSPAGKAWLEHARGILEAVERARFAVREVGVAGGNVPQEPDRGWPQGPGRRARAGRRPGNGRTAG